MRIRTDTGQFLNETAMACGWGEGTGIYALAQVVNSLAAAGADCMGVEVQILFPPHADRGKAYAMKKEIGRICRARGVDLKGTKIKQYPLQGIPVVMVSGIGHILERESVQIAEQNSIRAAREIVLVGWIGMEGMLRIADEKEDELRQRFAPVFIHQIQSYRDRIFAGKELKIARNAKVTQVYQITEGGILAVLWQIAKENGMGIEADMRRMSILQETIEVCEHYRLNPYQMTSAGSFLMLAKDGRALAKALKRDQIEASVIGRTTAGNDKVIYNGEDIRYLDRPAPDEIYKIFL